MNEADFETLFREHYAQLCKYAGRYVVDSQVAEDIVQNFFILVWEKRNLSVTSEIFLPYAYCAIKNSCINYYKSESIKETFFATLAEEWQQQLDEEEDFMYQREVQQALAKLPEKCKKVFLLKCLTGLRYKEIAEISDISVNTVKYHLGEAFRIMREELNYIVNKTMCLLLLISVN
ncbi:MAG: RNA polymerase sigma-70 factor [Tannerellaceae bacterium]